MNIYVGNLSYEVTEEALQESFEAFGHIESVRIVKDSFSGKSKGTDWETSESYSKQISWDYIVDVRY